MNRALTTIKCFSSKPVMLETTDLLMDRALEVIDVCI